MLFVFSASLYPTLATFVLHAYTSKANGQELQRTNPKILTKVSGCFLFLIIKRVTRLGIFDSFLKIFYLRTNQTTLI